MKKTVVYSCPFVPAEWIFAHGLRPSRILPQSNGTPTSPELFFEVCPYARRFFQEVLRGPSDAVILTTVCDQMRRLSELIARRDSPAVFVLNVPATWQTRTAHRLYVSELERLGRFLVRLGGKSPTPDKLSKVMRGFDRARQALRSARTQLAPREFSQALAEFHHQGEPEKLQIPKPRPFPRGIPLALIGGPLPDYELFDWVQTAGGSIVLDASETGERTLPAPFDPVQNHDSGWHGQFLLPVSLKHEEQKDTGNKNCPCHPESNHSKETTHLLLSELANAYFGTIPDIARRPNTELYRWFNQLRSEREIRGVIYRYYLWCDKWRAELIRFRESVDVPVLELDVGDEGESTRSRTKTRIEAFLESLR